MDSPLTGAIGRLSGDSMIMQQADDFHSALVGESVRGKNASQLPVTLEYRGIPTNFTELDFAEDSVVLVNWGAVHLMYMRPLREITEHYFAPLSKARVPARLVGRVFWQSLPTSVSERQPQISTERLLLFNALMRAALIPNGWVELPFESITAPVAFEAGDGLHHGPLVRRMDASILVSLLCEEA
jgi:hypothetical protein